MSRYSSPIWRNAPPRAPIRPVVNYGYDDTLGYWYDVLNQTGDEEVEGKCSIFDGLTGPQLMERLDEFNVIISDQHRTAMMADLPF
jgi:hypothetical protein